VKPRKLAHLQLEADSRELLKNYQAGENWEASR
jgi:hypothetical protein